MKPPTRLPIARVEDYHTHYLGRTARGQLFWAYGTFVFEASYFSSRPREDWQQFRREYAIIHTFTKKGEHLATKHWYAGLTATVDQQLLQQKLEEFVAEVGPVTFQDIKIGLFQTRIDGCVFGLVVDAENDLLNLEPSATISFQAPWDGEYYT